MTIDLTKYSGSPTRKIEKWSSMTIRIETPNGYLYLTIIEDEKGRPIRLESVLGKAGSGSASWARAVDELINLLLENGVGIDHIIDKLAGISSEKPRRTPSGIYVRSGPDGIAVAFMEYKRQKYKEMKEKFDDDY